MYASAQLARQVHYSMNEHRNSIYAQNDSLLYFKMDETQNNIDEIILKHAESGVGSDARLTSDTVFFVFNQGFAMVFLATNENATYTSSEAVFLNDTAAYLIIETGQYDVFGTKNRSLSKYFFFLEQETLSNNDTIFFLDQQAKHEAEFVATDINGNPLRAYEGVKTKQIKLFFPAGMHTDLISFKMDEEKSLFFSEVSGRYRLFPAFVQRDISVEKIFHIIQYEPLAGIDSDVLLNFSTGNYLKQTFRMHFDPGSNLFRFGYLDGTKWKNGQGKWEASFSGVITSVDETPWEVDFFYTPDQASDTGTSFLFNLYNADNYSFYQTRPFSIIQDSLINDFDASSPLAVPSVNNDLRDYGNGLVSCSIEFDNFISFSDFVISKVGNPTIRGMFLEDRITETLQSQYFIRDTAGNILDFGLFGSFQQFSADVSRCVFQVIDNNYLINESFGEAILNMHIDFENEDRNPPLITAAMILDWKNLPRAQLRTSDPASLRFSAKDASSPDNINGILLDSIQARISLHGEDNWSALELFHTGSGLIDGEIFEADLSEYTHNESTYDLQLVCYDSSLNKTEYFVRPAFAVSDYLSSEDEVMDQWDAASVIVFPNPTIDYLNLEFAEKTNLYLIEIFSINGICFYREKADQSIIQLNMKDLPSGIYLLKVSGLERNYLKTIIKK